MFSKNSSAKKTGPIPVERPLKQTRSLKEQLFKQTRPQKKKPYIHHSTPPELIDVTKLKAPRPPLNKPDFEVLDKLLSSPVIKEKADSSRGEGVRTSSELTGTETEKNTDRPPFSPYTPVDFRRNRSLAASIIGRRSLRDKSERTREKYGDRNFPLPVSKKQLKAKTEKHLDIVPKILAGEIELAIYYNLATDQRRQSPYQEMSPIESFDIPFHKYIAGFYGLVRQSYISSLIQEKYGELLRKSRNKTLLYWTPERFATYVLANEIIIRLVSEDMKISNEEAETLLRKTSDFGCDVADEIELIDDLEFTKRKI